MCDHPQASPEAVAAVVEVVVAAADATVLATAIGVVGVGAAAPLAGTSDDGIKHPDASLSCAKNGTEGRKCL